MRKTKIEGLAEKDQRAILEFTQEIRHIFGKRIKMIKLFGSKARGEAEEFSDIDIFVLIDRLDQQDRKIIGDISFKLDLKYDVVLSPIIYSEDEYNDPKYQVTPFLQTVEKEGISV